MSFDATLELAPRASMRALALLFALHVGALLLMLLALPPGAPLAALGLGLGGSWLWVRRHPALGFGPRAPVRLRWHADGRWTLQFAGGREDAEAELRGDSYAAGPLVLRFRLRDGRTCSRVLLGDELEPAAWRRLRARLRERRRPQA